MELRDAHVHLTKPSGWLGLALANFVQLYVTVNLVTRCWERAIVGLMQSVA
jgi:hypothetical protein